MRKFLSIAVLLLYSIAVSADSILLEAEAFSSKGGWSVDQQFMDLMGSPYLIAHGLGKPVADATTSVSISDGGLYHIYVRTFNWTSPWTKKEGPGAFRIKVNGKMLKRTLGTTGTAWEWQYAGDIRLESGKATVSLADQSGFDGRCDAIYLTTDKGAYLPNDKDGLESFRRACGTLSKSAEDGGRYDLIVVGGGIGGICTAVSASRLGMRVALVQDRPILGGNNSSEIRVHLGGKIEIGKYPALGRLVREFGHSTFGNARPAESYEDEKKTLLVESEKNISLFTSFRAVSTEMDGNAIKSIIIRNVENGTEKRISAPLYSDCTGDANLGFMAGADYRMGREGRDEFGEPLAPEHADKLTMGSSVQWYSVEGKKSTFPEFSYGITFNDENCEKVTMGEWTWETGMNYDQIYDFERIRDYGMLVIYSNWSFLKNHSLEKENYSGRELGWVAYIAGKRESRRLMGDYILKQDDVEKHVYHEDASFPINWHFDLHFPDSRNSTYFPGSEFKAETKNNPIAIYNVPYRCLYSRNIANLFMAGRDISTTHVTLGSTRLMRTIAMMGEVVGMAASICKEHNASPRDVYQRFLPELKSLMQKGVSKDVSQLPDNQHFNEGDNFEKPKDIIFK